MRSPVSAVITISLLVSTSGLSAQETPILEPGTRVRVWAPAFGLEKQVGFIEGDSVLLDLPLHYGASATMTVPLSSLTRLEAHRGRQDDSQRGALVGGVLGLAVGALIRTDRWERIPLDRLSAQPPPSLEPGARIRVTAPGCGIDKHVVTVEALRGDTLVLPGDRSQSSNPGICPISSVRRLEVIRGRRSHVVEGAATGGIVGALGFAFLGAASAKALDTDQGAELMFAGAASGAAVGALLGASIGLLIKTDRWEEVSLDRVRVSFAPKRDGRFALGVRLAF